MVSPETVSWKHEEGEKVREKQGQAEGQSQRISPVQLGTEEASKVVDMKPSNKCHELRSIYGSSGCFLISLPSSHTYNLKLLQVSASSVSVHCPHRFCVCRWWDGFQMCSCRNKIICMTEVGLVSVTNAFSVSLLSCIVHEAQCVRLWICRESHLLSASIN